MSHPSTRTNFTKGNKNYNFGRFFLGRHYYRYTLGLSHRYSNVEKKILKEIFYPNIISPLGEGHKIHNLCLFPLLLLHTTGANQ